MSCTSNKGQRKKKAPRPLPKAIRDELRMTCVLKGYSAIKCGGGKTLSRQYSDIAKIFHGKQPNHPSQISLLCNASYSYRALFDTLYHLSTKKDDDVKKLKHTFSLLF